MGQLELDDLRHCTTPHLGTFTEQHVVWHAQADTVAYNHVPPATTDMYGRKLPLSKIRNLSQGPTVAVGLPFQRTWKTPSIWTLRRWQCAVCRSPTQDCTAEESGSGTGQPLCTTSGQTANRPHTCVV